MSNARSPSGQWYPQNPSWASGATMPVQYSPAGTPPPSPGGYNGNPAMLQQQQQQRANLNGSGVLNNSGTWNGSATPTPPGFGVGGGVMPGQQQMPFGMYGGMNGMNPNMMMMQPSGCCDCCGNQQQSCCGNEQQGCCGGPQGGCCGNQQQGCCGGPQGGCCPMPGEPPDPFVCTSTPMNPACYECIYNCFDYSFLLACVLFALTVVGFGVVVGTKDIDDIYTKFGASNASELDLAMKPYIKWMNPNMCNTTTNESSSSSSADSNLSASSSLGNSFDDDSQASDTSTIARQRDGFSTPLSVYYYYAAENEAMVGNSTGSSSDGSGSGNETECLHNYTKPCTERRLKGSFGVVCMEDNLNANVFAVQLSQWNNARDTLWFVAMAFTGFAILYAGLIHSQRHPNPMNMLDGGAFNPATLPPEKQAELMKMTPQQQQQFIMEYQMQQQQQQPQLSFSASNMANPNEMNMNAEQQQQMAMMMQQQQQQQGCGPSGSIEFYETPYYEFVRFAWGFVGLTAFVWAINLCLSFWAFSSFYVESTEGPLHDFWKKYAGKFSGSVVVVTVYLAWPLCNVALDAVVMVVGIIPWLVIRSTCKTNIGNYRPNLPVSQLPGWIRTDMFFMDFADLKRLGFSRNAWIILTGSTRPFFDTCCVDPTVDTDPSMTSLLVQRYQFQLQMYAMMPPWMRGMMPPPMPPPQLNMTAEQFQQQFGMAPPGMAGAMGGMYGGAQGGGNAMPGSSAHTPPEAALHDPANKPLDGGATPNTARHRRRHRSSGSRAHSVENIAMQDSGATPGEGRRRRTHTHADPAEEAANGADGTPRRRKHRSHSRSRSRSNSKGLNAGEVPTPTADAAGGGAAAALLTPTGGEKSESHRHRRRSHSRSMSREVAVPVADDPSGAAATPGGGSKSRRHHHRSTSVPAEEGASRSRRHSSRSKSRSRSKGKGRSKKDKKDKKDKKADNELDALMQL